MRLCKDYNSFQYFKKNNINAFNMTALKTNLFDESCCLSLHVCCAIFVLSGFGFKVMRLSVLMHKKICNKYLQVLTTKHIFVHRLPFSHRKQINNINVHKNCILVLRNEPPQSLNSGIAQLKSLKKTKTLN